METNIKGTRLAAALAAAIVTLGAATMPALAQDAAKGEKVFKKCKSCHEIGEGAKNKTGPELNGIVGRMPGAVEGYKYSTGMTDLGAAGNPWDETMLDAFLTKPKDYVKKTKMSFAGLKKDADRANVIAYLAQFNADGTMK